MPFYKMSRERDAADQLQDDGALEHNPFCGLTRTRRTGGVASLAIRVSRRAGSARITHSERIPRARSGLCDLRGRWGHPPIGGPKGTRCLLTNRGK